MIALEAVIERALRLSPEDRSELITRLLETLDADVPPDPGHEAAWTEVIDRRVREIQEGRTELIDASVSIARAREAAMAAAARRKR